MEELGGICGWDSGVEPAWDAGSQECGVDQRLNIAVGNTGAACGSLDAAFEDRKGALGDVVGDELAGSRGELGAAIRSKFI